LEIPHGWFHEASALQTNLVDSPLYRSRKTGEFQRQQPPAHSQVLGSNSSPNEDDDKGQLQPTVAGCYNMPQPVAICI
jgi:hypothetical protein